MLFTCIVFIICIDINIYFDSGKQMCNIYPKSACVYSYISRQNWNKNWWLFLLCFSMCCIQSRSGESGPCEYFRLEQLQEEFDFATEAELAANRRFQLLSLRDREVAEFRNAKMIAPFEREIPRDAFAVSFVYIVFICCCSLLGTG